MEIGHGLTKKHKKALIIIGTVAAVYFGIRYLLPLFVPFLIAYFIAWLLRPIVSFLHSKLRFPIFLGAVLCVLVLIALLGVVLFFLFQLLFREGFLFLKNLPEYLTVGSSVLMEFCQMAEEKFALKQGTLINIVNAAMSKIQGRMADQFIPSIAEKLLKLLSSAGGFLAVFLIVIIGAVFFIKDMQEYKAGIRKSEFYPAVHKITQKLSDTGVAYLKTQMIIMSIIAVIVSLAFLLIKNPYALLIGIFVGIFDAFPVLGSGFILVPWAVVSLVQKDIFSGAVILTAYVICQVTREVLEPKLLGNRIGIQPIYNLIAMYVGVRLFGILGFFLGPIALVIIRLVVQENCKSDIYC